MKYFIIAGEASGDLHGSNLMKAIKANDPNASFAILGGDLMAQQGATPIRHYKQMAFMGFINVLININTILDNMKACKNALIQFNPDVVILIDYPSFNLRIAKFVKQHLNVPVFYYISPKLWAWKSHRIKAIKKYIDEMFTIFPFETQYFKNKGYQVNYVGNPTVDSVSQFQANYTDNTFRLKHNLSDAPIVALLAGSRKQEINNCLPTLAQVADRFPKLQFVIAGAPGASPDLYKHVQRDNITLVFGETYPLLANANYAIVNSGTATLETAIFKVPQIVIYHVFGGKAAMLLKNLVIKTKFISLVNLIGEKEVVKELIANLFTPENVERELNKLIHELDYRQNMLLDYNDIQHKLGLPGAANTAATLMIQKLNKKNNA